MQIQLIMVVKIYAIFFPFGSTVAKEMGGGGFVINLKLVEYMRWNTLDRAHSN